MFISQYFSNLVFRADFIFQNGAGLPRHRWGEGGIRAMRYIEYRQRLIREEQITLSRAYKDVGGLVIEYCTEQERVTSLEHEISRNWLLKNLKCLIREDLHQVQLLLNISFQEHKLTGSWHRLA